MPDDLQIVYSGTSVAAAMLKDLLEQQGIESFLKDQFIGTMAPYYDGSGGLGAVKVMVRAADIDRAQDIVRDFNRTA